MGSRGCTMNASPIPQEVEDDDRSGDDGLQVTGSQVGVTTAAITNAPTIAYRHQRNSLPGAHEPEPREEHHDERRLERDPVQKSSRVTKSM